MATGLYGKLPAHGDFIRRALPDDFVLPWDEWLQAGIAAAREALGEDFPATWDAAPPWRFRLPPGACGPLAAAGLLMPSEDLVGRRFPVTLAALLAPGAPAPPAAWYDALEAAARAGRDADADTLLGTLPAPPAEAADAPAEGWWMAGDIRWDLPALVPPARFRVLLEGRA